MNLARVREMVQDLNRTNSSTDKLNTLKQYPDCKNILLYTYHPLWKYNVSSDNCKKQSNLVGKQYYTDILELLDALRNREHTGHDAIKEVNAFVAENADFAELIWGILDGNLKCRIDVKLINKAYPGLIPEFNVALCDKYTEKSDLSGEWYISRKLDGVRCIAVKRGTEVKFYSRAGNEFETLANLVPDVLAICPYDFVLDGEICLVDESGKEDFIGVVSEIKRKDHTMKNPKYYVFDYLTHGEFFSGENIHLFSNRYKLLVSCRTDYNRSSIRHITILEQMPYTLDQFELMQQKAIDNEWEGLILRKDVPYEGKRTKNMLKVKVFQDAEYIVKDIISGPIRYIKDGKDTEEIMLSAICIEHKGYKVNVGSGFSIEQRKAFYADPFLIIGKTILVKYFGESRNKNLELSLRFPTVKHIYENGRNV